MFIGPCVIIISEDWEQETDVVIQQHSRKLVMMDILMYETCWARKKWNKIASDIKLVFHSSTNTSHIFGRIEEFERDEFLSSQINWLKNEIQNAVYK